MRSALTHPGCWFGAPSALSPSPPAAPPNRRPRGSSGVPPPSAAHQRETCRGRVCAWDPLLGTGYGGREGVRWSVGAGRGGSREAGAMLSRDSRLRPPLRSPVRVFRRPVDSLPGEHTPFGSRAMPSRGGRLGRKLRALQRRAEGNPGGLPGPGTPPLPKDGPSDPRRW